MNSSYFEFDEDNFNLCSLIDAFQLNKEGKDSIADLGITLAITITIVVVVTDYFVSSVTAFIIIRSFISLMGKKGITNATKLEEGMLKTVKQEGEEEVDIVGFVIILIECKEK